MSVSSSSNFMINQNPQKYGGKQSDYIQKRDKVIENELYHLQSAVQQQKDLKQLFHEILASFAKTRHDLAVSHGTEEVHYFGRRRWDVISDIPYTPLLDSYREFNKKILQFMSEFLKGSIPIRGDLSKKKFRVETITYLGRKCSFELELLTPKDISDREWDKIHPSYQQEALESLERTPEINNVNEDNYPPSREEQNIIDTFKQRLKRFKENYPATYIYDKMNFILRGIHNTFPSPQKIYVPESNSVRLEGNTDNLKSIFVLGKVRIEIKGKMYALSEYMTWTYQDHETDPAERMKRSTVVIIHQDQFLIDDTLNEVSSLFEKVINWKRTGNNINELKQQVAVIRYLFAHCMPYQRGSAAIGEWLEKLIYQFHNFKCEHNENTMGDLEAMTAPLCSTFLEKYDTTIKLSH